MGKTAVLPGGQCCFTDPLSVAPQHPLASYAPTYGPHVATSGLPVLTRAACRRALPRIGRRLPATKRAARTGAATSPTASLLLIRCMLRWAQPCSAMRLCRRTVRVERVARGVGTLCCSVVPHKQTRTIELKVQKPCAQLV
jgi:hypothetical protein